MKLIYQSHPDVWLGGNCFRNTPVILQYEDLPLLEVGKFEPAGYTTKFPVFHSDGTHIADVKGARIFLTNDGKNAKITSRFEPRKTVFEFEGRPILELNRDEAGALKGWAELYATEGVLIKAFDSGVSGLLGNGTALQIGGTMISGNIFDGVKIGIHITATTVNFGP